MNLAHSLTQLVLSYVVGTVLLWLCSHTVQTQRATLKTAAIYSAIMRILYVFLLLMGVWNAHAESGPVAVLFLVTCILTIIASYWLLMRMYQISFAATSWLFLAIWAVETVVVKLVSLLR
ncbi:MAG: hypothetical protein GX803_09560 [Lentisphaerae bacterium]|jgi:hypothetical protein|nr:hypothetical protein [Lentisphaerota bacterium]